MDKEKGFHVVTIEFKNGEVNCYDVTEDNFDLIDRKITKLSSFDAILSFHTIHEERVIIDLNGVNVVTLGLEKEEI